MDKKYSMELAGRTLTLEFGRYAQQANGSVLIPAVLQPYMGGKAVLIPKK